MNVRLATQLLWVATGFWLVVTSTVVALAAEGEPPLPPAINMVLFAGLSTGTITLLVIRSHAGLAGRLDRLKADVDSLSERLDHRDAALYRDFIRRLDEMKKWMMRPAIPRGRATAVAVAVEEETETAPLPVVAHNIDRDVIDIAARAAKRIRDAGR